MPDFIKDWIASWPDYLRAHSKPETRALHYLQTIAGGSAILFCLFTFNWLWLIVVIVAILINALIAHFLVEGNSPAAFGEPPWWSVASDIRMTGHWVTGTLKPELKKAGVTNQSHQL